MPSELREVWVVRGGETVLGAGSTYYSALGEARNNGLGGAISGRLADGAERGASVVVLGGGYSIAREHLLTPAAQRVLEAAVAERDAMAALVADPGDFVKEHAWSLTHTEYDTAVRAWREGAS